MFQVLKLSKQINSRKNSCLGLGSFTLPSFKGAHEHIAPNTMSRVKTHFHLSRQDSPLHVIPRSLQEGGGGISKVPIHSLTADPSH